VIWTEGWNSVGCAVLAVVVDWAGFLDNSVWAFVLLEKLFRSSYFTDGFPYENQISRGKSKISMLLIIVGFVDSCGLTN
jgi:hypothetical protein